MSRFFIRLYYWFRNHRAAFWTSLFASIAVLVLMASRIQFEENITSFFPSSKNTANMADVFSHLKVSDKIIVMFNAADTSQVPGPETLDSLYMASGRLGELLGREDRIIDKYVGSIGQADAAGMINFVLDHLPSFMEDSDYERLSELDSPEAVDSAIMNDYINLISPAGFAMKDYIMADPLAIGGSVMSRTARLNPATDYVIRDGHVFTPGGKTMLSFIEPAFASGETGRNDKLVNVIDNALDTLSKEFPTVRMHYFGGPVMSVYNARQIKRDTYSTSIVALIIIVLFILAVFKRRRSIFLILCPVLYGAIFALAMSWLLCGSISGIAVGAGAAIMGIALSYSIHLLAHQNYVHDIPQLLDELCNPLIIGSVTTVGAFAGLLFTSSGLLQDFGLFAALTLVGTMLFCLVFLPQFLVGQADLREGRVLRVIEKISSYPYDKNKWLKGALVVLTAVCIYMSTKVGFESDMMGLTYWEPKLKEAEQILTAETADSMKTVMFVSVGRTAEDAYKAYENTSQKLESMRVEGLVEGFSDGDSFICGPEEQQARIDKWNAWWSDERVEKLTAEVRAAALRYGFREDAFDGALARLSKKYEPLDYFSDKSVPEAFTSWVGASDDLKMFITQVTMDKENIDEVYARFADDHDVVIFDQGYFAGKAAEGINNDFYLILFISSFLIFFVLWLSYGRLELALLSFLPMAISWVIITGIMGMLGVQFNIVNIILSTFIFGMGDDFSIFIMEGLLYKYKTGKKLLDPHKTAIFFSAFTMIVGIGALVFARHPALHSIAIITILGMFAVVLVAYTAEPVIFNAFVTKPTSQGRPPFTLWAILRNIVFYIPPVLGSAFILLLSFMAMLVPSKKSSRQAAIGWMLHRACRILVGYAAFIHPKRIGPDGELIRSWNGEAGVIVANHQSSLDIIMILATFPKVKFMVADWVLTSPLFGVISRFLGYYSRSEGYEKSLERLRVDVADGWCLAVFPEGTRSLNGKIKRFHKGAFYLASQVGVPVIPVVFYGNWRIAPKNQGFNMTEGIAVTEILPPVQSAGVEYHELTSRISAIVKAEYAELCRKYDSPVNPYFRKALVSSYIYKGPVTEWYVKVKTKMEDSYSFFHSVLPREGRITDIGCGMGQMDFMLSMYCPERRIIGIDYDADKIAVAQNSWLLKNLPDLEFRCGNASECELPESNAFVISDMLHYLDVEAQEALIRRCAEKLLPGGMILVRDSDSENAKGQTVTALSEVFSTRILAFNRTQGELNFISHSRMSSIASAVGLKMTVRSNDAVTSNTFYILKF